MEADYQAVLEVLATGGQLTAGHILRDLGATDPSWTEAKLHGFLERMLVERDVVSLEGEVAWTDDREAVIAYHPYAITDQIKNALAGI